MHCFRLPLFPASSLSCDSQECAHRAKNVSSYVTLFLIGWQVNCFTLRFPGDYNLVQSNAEKWFYLHVNQEPKHYITLF